MKRYLQIIVVSLLMLAGTGRVLAADELTSQLQKGLLEEEVHRNYSEALKAYQAAVAAYDANRQAAATAVFRLAETYRKLGKTNEARVQYERVLFEFADQSSLVSAVLKQMQIDFGKTVLPQFMAAKGLDDAERKRLETELRIIESQVASLKKLDAEALPIALLRLEFSERLSKLLLSRDQLLQKRAISLKDYSPQHPEIKALDKGLEETRRLIAQESGIMLQQLEEKGRLIGEQLSGAGVSSGAANPSTGTIPGRLTAQAGVPAEEQAEIERLQAMLKNSPDLINAKMEGQPIPLHRAAGLGQPAVAEFLIKNGADINRKDNGMEWTPLLAAAFNGHRAMVELLLRNGADKEAMDSQGQTAIIMAASKGYRAVVEELIGAGANVNAQDGGGYSALHYAAAAGDFEMTERLLKVKADTGLKTVNATWMSRKDEKGATPLHLAAKTNNLAVVSALLTAGADINARDANEWTPLFAAFTQGNGEMVKKLLDAKADVLVRTLGGYSILHYIKKSSTAEMVGQLLQAGAVVNVLDDNGTTPLMSAVRSDNLGVVKLLVEHGADPNILPRDGVTPLLSAISSKNTEVVRLLLANKAKVDKLPEASPWQHPVIVAAKSGETDILKELINYGADLSVTNDKGYTSLHYAVAAMNVPMVELLLKHKADPNAESNDGETPVTLAQGGAIIDLDNVGRRISTAPSISGVISARRPLPPSGRKATADEVKAGFAQIVKLLVEHGGDEFFKRRKTISVSRRARQQEEVVFRVDANRINRFSLYELLAMVCGNQMNSSYHFPDLKRIAIERLKGREITSMAVDVASPLEAGECSGDIWLEWGDVVEIPEEDHKLSDSWLGLSEATVRTLTDCTKRNVTLKVKDQSYDLTLCPTFISRARSLPGVPAKPGTVAARPEPITTILVNCRLSAVIYGSKAMLSSSDTTRIKVTRPVSGKAEKQEFIYGLPKTPITNDDLWLRGGDVIEVPEKE